MAVEKKPFVVGQSPNLNDTHQKGILEILNENAGSDKLMVPVGATKAMLTQSANQLDVAGYKLALEEISNDEKCLDVYLGKLDNYSIRVAQLKNDWTRKRMDIARQAAEKWMLANATQQYL